MRPLAAPLCTALSLAVLCAAAPPAESGPKPRIAVIEFKNKAAHAWGNAGAAAQDILISELVRQEAYTVLDRERLAAVMQEKKLSLSGEVDPKTAIKAGQLLGVEYLVTGSVTEFGSTKSRASTGGWGVRGLPPVDVGTNRFTAAIDARAVSTTTGEIVWADTARESTTDARVFVAGAGGGGVDEAQADKVIRPICAQLAASLSKKKLASSGLGGKGDASGVAGKVAMVDASGIYVNVGSDTGVQAGHTFEVVRRGKVIRDPDTGEVLGADETRVGQIQVVEVKGPRLSLCRVTSGGAFQTGDLLK